MYKVLGDAALNMLGLSTQVVAKYVYLSDGPNRSYDILGTTLEFKKSSLKNIGFKYKESLHIVQALKTLGKERVTEEVMGTIRKRIEPKMYSRQVVWIYEAIKQICRGTDDG